jgi:hypothetical protein
MRQMLGSEGAPTGDVPMHYCGYSEEEQGAGNRDITEGAYADDESVDPRHRQWRTLDQRRDVMTPPLTERWQDDGRRVEQHRDVMTPPLEQHRDLGFATHHANARERATSPAPTPNKRPGFFKRFKVAMSNSAKKKKLPKSTGTEQDRPEPRNLELGSVVPTAMGRSNGGRDGLGLTPLLPPPPPPGRTFGQARDGGEEEEKSDDRSTRMDNRRGVGARQEVPRNAQAQVQAAAAAGGGEQGGPRANGRREPPQQEAAPGHDDAAAAIRLRVSVPLTLGSRFSTSQRDAVMASAFSVFGARLWRPRHLQLDGRTYTTVATEASPVVFAIYASEQTTIVQQDGYDAIMHQDQQLFIFRQVAHDEWLLIYENQPEEPRQPTVAAAAGGGLSSGPASPLSAPSEREHISGGVDQSRRANEGARSPHEYGHDEVDDGPWIRLIASEPLLASSTLNRSELHYAMLARFAAFGSVMRRPRSITYDNEVYTRDQGHVIYTSARTLDVGHDEYDAADHPEEQLFIFLRQPNGGALQLLHAFQPEPLQAGITHGYTGDNLRNILQSRGGAQNADHASALLHEYVRALSRHHLAMVRGWFPLN